MSETLFGAEALSALGETHPYVNRPDLEAAILREHHFTAAEACVGLGHPVEPHDPLDLVTISVIVARNGFVVVGSYTPPTPDDYDPVEALRLAREDAVQKLWQMLGYVLRDRLHAKLTSAAIVASKAD